MLNIDILSSLACSLSLVNIIRIMWFLDMNKPMKEIREQSNNVGVKKIRHIRWIV